MQDDEREAIERLIGDIEAEQKRKPDLIYGCSIGGCLGMIAGPALLVIMGVIIAALLLSLYMPLFQLSNALS